MQISVTGLLLLFFTTCIGHAQVFQLPEVSSFYVMPGSATPKSKDLAASMKGYVTRDSIVFEINVQDDRVVSHSAYEQSDRVEVWFGLPDVDFSDYLLAEHNNKLRIFRNSAESGDNADIKRFVENADYPKGEMYHPETGERAMPDVPPGESLRRDYVFYGITHFVFNTDNSGPKQADREKYIPFERHTGYKTDDLSGFASYSCTIKPGGYTMRIAMHNRCLGFALSPTMTHLRYAVDVIDTDKKGDVPVKISSSPNRYYGRPMYFTEVKLPFELNIPMRSIPETMMRKLGMQFQAVYSEGDWKPYFFSNGPIIYAKEFLSDAGLVEYIFIPAEVNYQEISGSAKVPQHQRLEITYDDPGAFLQRELYFIIEDTILVSSKGYRFNEIVEGDNFHNTVFRLEDGSPAAVLYDYEPIDPLGWGELGHTSDEFTYIQKLDKKGGVPIFNAGHRIEATGKATIGDPKIMGLENLERVEYRWIEFGKKFELRAEFKSPGMLQRAAPPETYTFEIGADGKVNRVK